MPEADNPRALLLEFANGDDLLAVDEDVGCGAPRGGDDGAAGDQCRAHGAEIPS